MIQKSLAGGASTVKPADSLRCRFAERNPDSFLEVSDTFESRGVLFYPVRRRRQRDEQDLRPVGQRTWRTRNASDVGHGGGEPLRPT